MHELREAYCNEQCNACLSAVVNSSVAYATQRLDLVALFALGYLLTLSSLDHECEG